MSSSEAEFHKRKIIFEISEAAGFFEIRKSGGQSIRATGEAGDEVLNELLKREHGTILPDDFVRAIAENEEAVE